MDYVLVMCSDLIEMGVFVWLVLWAHDQVSNWGRW